MSHEHGSHFTRGVQFAFSGEKQKAGHFFSTLSSGSRSLHGGLPCELVDVVDTIIVSPQRERPCRHSQYLRNRLKRLSSVPELLDSCIARSDERKDTTGPEAMAHSRLKSLPPELLHTILSNLDPTSLLKTRLTCRLLSILGLDYFSNEIPLVFQPRQVKKCDGDSNAPRVVQTHKISVLCRRPPHATGMVRVVHQTLPRGTLSQRRYGISNRNRATSTSFHVETATRAWCHGHA